MVPAKDLRDPGGGSSLGTDARSLMQEALLMSFGCHSDANSVIEWGLDNPGVYFCFLCSWKAPQKRESMK